MRLEGQPSNPEEPKKKKSTNIFEKIGRMDGRAMSDALDGILEAGKKRDIAWFTFTSKDQEGTSKNENAEFLDRLDNHIERALTITHEVLTHVDEGTAQILSVGKENNSQAVGFFIPIPGEDHKHIFFFDNGEIYTSQPTDPSFTEKYKNLMENWEVSFPDVPSHEQGRVTDDSVKKVIGILADEKYGVSLSKGEFEKTVEQEYQKQRRHDKKVAWEKRTKDMLETAESWVMNNRYDSFNGVLDAMNDGKIPHQRLTKKENPQNNEDTLS